MAEERKFLDFNSNELLNKKQTLPEIEKEKLSSNNSNRNSHNSTFLIESTNDYQDEDLFNNNTQDIKVMEPTYIPNM